MLRQCLIDNATGYPLSPLEKDEKKQYPFPNSPCGILPFYINPDNKIAWGCIEANRTGVKSSQPPAGSQDIIVIKDNERFSIEVSKAFPDLKKDFMKPFTGKNVNGQNYQEIMNCFIDNGYEVYLENMLATATRETFEENGTDLRINGGKNLDLLINMFDFPPHVIKAKRGMTTQKIYAAHLSGDTGIQLNYTDKIEEGIAINKGRTFYEKGIWCTLEDLKKAFQEQKINFAQSEKDGLTEDQIKLMESEFIAWESRIDLIEKVEASIIPSLKNMNINSISQAQKIEFSLMDKLNMNKDNFAKNWTMLTLFGANNTIYDANEKSFKDYSPLQTSLSKK